MTNTVLLVDDEPSVLSAYTRVLRGHSLVLANNGEEALQAVQSCRPAVVVSDMFMPGMTGLELLSRIAELSPETVRIMMTGRAELELAIRAMHEGRVFRFLTKPCAPEYLRQALNAGLEQHALLKAERELLEGTLNGTISVLTEILRNVAPSSFGRSQRVRNDMSRLAYTLGLAHPYTYALAAMLAPIGQVTVPPSVVQARHEGRPLSDAEQQMLARVPEVGAQMLSSIPRMEEVAEIVRFQSRHFDGTGPPTEPRQGTDIPIGARMLLLLTDRQDLLRLGAVNLPDQLRLRRGFYDPALLEALEAAFPVPPVPPGFVTLQIAVPQLAPGDRLATDVFGRDGLLLLSSCTRVSPTVRERLTNYCTLGYIDPQITVTRPKEGTDHESA